MDRLIEQFFGEQVPDSTNSQNPPTYYLPVDIFETDEAYTLVASVPGFKEDQVEVTFEDEILTIKANRGAQAPWSLAAPGAAVWVVRPSAGSSGTGRDGQDRRPLRQRRADDHDSKDRQAEAGQDPDRNR